MHYTAFRDQARGVSTLLCIWVLFFLFAHINYIIGWLICLQSLLLGDYITVADFHFGCMHYKIECFLLSYGEGRSCEQNMALEKSPIFLLIFTCTYCCWHTSLNPEVFKRYMYIWQSFCHINVIQYVAFLSNRYSTNSSSQQLHYYSTNYNSQMGYDNSSSSSNIKVNSIPHFQILHHLSEWCQQLVRIIIVKATN